MWSRIAFGILMLASFTLAPALWARAATELKLGHCSGTDDPNHIGATKFAELVAMYTANAVRVLVFPSCQLGSGEREMIEGVKLGTLEMVLTASAPIANFERKFILNFAPRD